MAHCRAAFVCIHVADHVALLCRSELQPDEVWELAHIGPPSASRGRVEPNLVNQPAGDSHRVTDQPRREQRVNDPVRSVGERIAPGVIDAQNEPRFGRNVSCESGWIVV